nr:serine/threonine protein kinase [Planctomycetota bacterium]
MNPDREARLVALVAEALARRESGAPLDLHGLCAGHPELRAEVAAALGLAPALPDLGSDARHDDPLRGRVLGGRYQLEHRLGAGAMGVVYRARDRELGRAVAVKLVQGGAWTPQAQARFRREAELLAQLHDPGIVLVHDRGDEPDGLAWLVMELLAGHSLAGVLQSVAEGGRERALASARATLGEAAVPEASWVRLVARWGHGAARALAAAHALGIAHRDVKPSNLFVRADGAIVLLDFGIAKSSGDAALTTERGVLGTPWYLAPEVAAGGAGGADDMARADVYGLGATLYHLLALRPPYQGDGTAVLAALQRRDPVPLARLAPLPRDLVAIVGKAMERAPRQRYAGADALARDLAAFLAHEPVRARPIGPLGRVWRRARLRPAASAALLLGIALVLALGSAIPAWARDRDARARDDKAGRMARLPALTALEGRPEDRAEADRRERPELLAEVAAILALDPEDVPVRLLHAALLWDDGRRAEAAAELRHIADTRGSAFFAALAQRHAGPAALPALDGLPAPVDDAERYALGFHLLRRRSEADAAAAEQALVAAERSYAPARDLLLLARLAVANATRDRAAAAQRFAAVEQAALRLEGEYGRPTARTRHAIGAALLGQRRYAEAIPALEESLRLRGDRHNVLHNLGLACYRTGRFAEAERHLRRALELKPRLWNSLHTLAQLARDRGEYAAARALAARIPESGPEGEAWKRALLLADVDRAEALARLAHGEPAAARELAQRARAGLATARGSGARGASLDATDELLAAVERGAAPEAFARSAAALLGDPANPVQLWNLSQLVPESGLDARGTDVLRELLHRLAVALAPSLTDQDRARGATPPESPPPSPASAPARR